MANVVRAAGGAVMFYETSGETGEWLVLVTHRPHYNDWSLPKGKRDPGETDEACATREVLEETGLSIVMHEELPPAEYIDHKGRPKVVRYWLMTLDPAQHDLAARPSFVSNDEVDEVRWLSGGDALAILDYPHDRDLVRQSFARLDALAAWQHLHGDGGI